MRIAVVLLLSMILSIPLLAQGTVRGTVSDPTGETIIGASVKVKELPGVFATTDLDGAYSVKLPDGNPYTLVVSFVTLRTQERTISAKGGEVVVVNVSLTEDKTELGPVVVERKARSTSDVRLERMKINSAASIDYISGEAMLKTGDGDANAAVRRVTGVSTAGAFVTVRGLADRYIVTTINGSRVPTLDPLTNNLRLDIFPTGLLDNIVITKTATPELPGDWSGAMISLNTSDYPEKLRVSVSSSLGYNPNSSFQTVVGTARGGADWLGRDDGSRGIPEGVSPDVELYPDFQEPQLYQQLSLLGLGPTLAGYGITPNTPGFQDSQMNGTPLQNLALTELGLLAPALINDPSAAQAAAAAYNSTYNLGFFSPLVNGELATLNRKWDNTNWRVNDRQGLPNFNQSISIGNSIELFKKAKNPKTLGFLLGFRYATETEYDGAATLERTSQDRADERPGFFFDFRGDQRVCTESNGWNALGSLSFKLDRNNTFSLLVMPNVLGQSNARYMVFQKPSVSGETFVAEDQFYEERRLWLHQFGSKHFIPGLRMKVQSDLSWSDGSRNILDLKTVQYIQPVDGGDLNQVDGALGQPSRIFRFLDETMLDARLALELPLSRDERKARSLRFGGAYRENIRRNSQAFFTVLRAPGPTQWEQPGRFDMQPDGTFLSLYAPFGTFRDNDIGISRITAGFAMADYAVSPRLRVVGGVRAEHTDLLTDIQRFYEQGLAANAPARGTVGNQAIGGASGANPQPANAGIIDQWDILPSVNLIYKLKDDEFTPMNLRVNYFRSLARPSFREFSVVQLFDYQLNATVFGNPDLRSTAIDNYDLRLERFFKDRDNVSLSLFYKRFTDHIELLSTSEGGFTWQNAPFSRIYGLELEGRIGILKSLEWRGNLTLMDSESELSYVLGDRTIEYTTPMFGQAPWIVNSMLSWSQDSARFTASVSYNVQGPRLAVTNPAGNPTQVQAFEMPRHMIDITLNKALGKHWGIRGRVRNLLNAPQLRSYRFNSGYDVDFDRFAWGTEYQLTISYTIK
jgi:hypothetical protein